MFTLERMKAAYETNKAALDVVEKNLDKEVSKLNAAVKAKTLPDEDPMKKVLKELHTYKQWTEALDLLIKAAEKKGSDLTEDEIKIALCKARTFPDVKVRPDKKEGSTGEYKKSFPNVDYDISGVLKKLEIDVNFKYDITLLAVTLTYGVSKLLKEKDVESCLTTYAVKEMFHDRLRDEKVQKKIKDGADLGSHRCAEKALQDVINAFLPSVKYKATEKDSAWFLLGSTSLDKKTVGTIKVAPYKVIEKMVFDCIHLKLINGGIAEYKVTYKEYKEKETKELPEDKKPEEPKSEEPKPEEAPKTEEPKSEAPAAEPAAEPVAAKPTKEPKSKKEPTSKRGSKGSKKSDKTAA